MAPLVGGGAPQTVHSRYRVRLESERMFCPGYMMVDYLWYMIMLATSKQPYFPFRDFNYKLSALTICRGI